MKKLLALVLAMVMTLGLATVGASAATVKYADKNDIDFSEAADVLSAVGVFQGKGENFAPKDNLNRAEAAKLVAYLMLGTKTAEAIKGNGNRFVDVPADHWAVGYIEYLATAGVVSGVGDNKFNPNGPVTAVQFAKMLNVALGYDAQVEGYVGNSWNINIMKQANDDDIFKGLSSVNSNDTLTREQAAQMCLNALKADTVEYESKGDTLTINNSTVVLNAKKAKDKTTTDTKGNAIKNDDAAGTVANPYKLQLGEDLYNGDLKKESTRDDFGRPASKWTYKNEKIGTYVDTSDLKAEYTAEIKRGPIYDLVGSSVYDHLVLANNARDYATLHYFEDGVPYGNTTDGLVNSSSSAATNKAEVEKFILKNGDKGINYNKTADTASSGNGSLTQVFIDKNDNVTITVVNTYVFKASSDYRASTEDLVISVPSDAKTQTIASIKNGRLELNDFPEIKDIKKDDYLLITAYKDGSVYTAKTVAKAEKLTATVDKVVKTDSVTLDGDKKEYNKTATDTTKGTEYSVGQEATVVLDKYGYIVYVDESVVANNYVFISELYQNGGSTTKVQANAYFTDGTNKTITIKELDKKSTKSTLITRTATTNEVMAAGVTDVNSTAAAWDASIYAGWYTYTKNAGDEYTLTIPSANSYVRENEGSGAIAGDTDLTYAEAVLFANNAAVANSANATLQTATKATAKANNKTIMVVAYGDKSDVDVYTGVDNLPDIKLKNTAGNVGRGAIFSVVDKNNGYAKYVFVTLEGDYSVFGSENENLLYVIKHDKTNVEKDNKNFFTYKVLDENAKEITVEAENDLRVGGVSNIYQAFYKTSKNADGRYTRIEAVPNSGKYINAKGETSGTNAISADGDTLTIAGNSFTLDKDFKLVVVSRDDDLNKKNTTKNSSFEANIMTAEGLEAMLKNYSYTYDFQAKLKDTYNATTGKNKLVEAYVTITDAVQTNTVAASTNSVNADILNVILWDNAKQYVYDTTNTMRSQSAALILYNTKSGQPSAGEVQYAIENAVKNSGQTVKSSEVDNKNKTVTVTTSTNKSYVVDYSTTAKVANYEIASVGYTSLSKNVTLTAGQSLSVASDLTIPAGVTVTVPGNVYVDATLNVNGSLNVTGNVLVTSKGHITNKNNVTATNIYVMDGDSYEAAAGSITIATRIDSYGPVTIASGADVTGAITVEAGGSLENSGNIVGAVTNNGGSVDLKAGAVKGTVTNNVGGSLKIEKNATVVGAVTNDGTATIETGATVTSGITGSGTTTKGEVSTGTTDMTINVTNYYDSDLKDYVIRVNVVGAIVKSGSTYTVTDDTVTLNITNNSAYAIKADTGYYRISITGADKSFSLPANGTASVKIEPAKYTNVTVAVTKAGQTA